MMLRTLTILTATVLALGALDVSPTLAQTKSGTTLKADMRVCTGILERQPQGTGSSFSATTSTVYCWSRISGATGEATVTHLWLLNGQEVSDTKLKIAPDAYRIWSQKNLYGRVGNWEVRALDANGNVIGSVSFTVK